MKAVKVQYTVKPEYVEQNKANIRKVMDKLKAEPIAGMLYSSYTLADGQTFVHINICKDQETLSKLGQLAEFNAFRTALKASGPIEPPQSTDLNPVGAGFEL
ncbi:MAG: hypothetical protein OEQ53_20990 [Saprospiraceae bacterium]|nr:hypothetical protein [Saprospiraceae bacterium]